MDRLLAGAGALDKLKQKAVWHVPCSSKCNQQDKVKLMTIHPNSEQRKKLKRYDIPGHAHELTFPVIIVFII